MKRATAKDSAVEKMVNRYSRESRILNPRPARGIENFMNFNDIEVLKTELLVLQGNEAGMFYNPSRRTNSGSNLHRAEYPALLDSQKILQAKFEIYKESEIKTGNRVPKTFPSNLEDQRIQLNARVKVAELEIEKLKGLIAPLEQAVEKQESAPVPRRSWSRCELKDGTLHKMAGWLCEIPENEEVLHIVDDRSPFDGMPVWQFKTQILKAIEMEESYRRRMELKASEAEERRPRPVEKTATPLWNPESKQIEYPNYSNVTIKKLKIDM